MYIELSDICGLKCDFCPSRKGIRGVMSEEKFQ
ncbi:radical SAM protein, partial [Campylobacter jejuni]|nr:radical SAM protein [Campylobacter jejuni]